MFGGNSIYEVKYINSSSQTRFNMSGQQKIQTKLIILSYKLFSEKKIEGAHKIKCH